MAWFILWFLISHSPDSLSEPPKVISSHGEKAECREALRLLYDRHPLGLHRCVKAEPSHDSRERDLWLRLLEVEIRQKSLENELLEKIR